METKFLKVVAMQEMVRPGDIVLNTFENRRTGTTMAIVAREYTYEQAMAKPGAKHAWGNPERWYTKPTNPTHGSLTEQECLDRYVANMREGARHDLTAGQKQVAQRMWAAALAAKVEAASTADAARRVTVLAEVDDV